MYDAIVNFHNRYGHTKVPCQWKQNPQLSAWTYRIKLNKGALVPQKIELLDAIGFEWNYNQKTVVAWELMYARLVAYRNNYGHTSVPASWATDRKLGKWVSRMRSQKEKLDLERIKLLEAINFDWVKVSKGGRNRKRIELIALCC